MLRRIHLYWSTTTTAGLVDSATIDLDALCRLQYGFGLKGQPYGWTVLRTGWHARCPTGEATPGYDMGGVSYRLDFKDGASWPEYAVSPLFPMEVDRDLNIGWPGTVTFEPNSWYVYDNSAGANVVTPIPWVDLAPRDAETCDDRTVGRWVRRLLMRAAAR